VDQDTGMRVGQNTKPGGPYGDGRITRSPAAGVTAARLNGGAAMAKVTVTGGAGPLAGQPTE
jgi:hypothetical protein